MKITINENQECSEPEIIIHCRKADENVLRMISALNALDEKLSGTKAGKTYLIELGHVLYFDTVDKKTFIYTDDDVYETGLKLYQLEQLSGNAFFRASKSVVMNIGKIRTIMPDFGGRLEVTLTNGETLFVSRQYSRELKQRIGM